MSGQTRHVSMKIWEGTGSITDAILGDITLKESYLYVKKGRKKREKKEVCLVLVLFLKIPFFHESV